jgi:ABC-type multidrug transport system ATPase subunit
MIVPLISLITQAIFYTLLTFYLDYVLPIDSSAKAHPFFFLGVKNKKEIMQHNDFNDLNKEKSKKYGEYFEIESQGLSDIEIVNLVKKWPNGEIAVKNASFKAYRGQVTALLGHNGAGKSTIFSCLTGFIKQTSGQIIIGAEAENSKIGYCPQWDPLFPLLTVEEHLYFYGNLKTSLSILKSEVDEVLEQVDLVHARRIRGNALSGGMKRKLCVGMAMVGRSRILLLDEPTAGMDPMARRGVLDIVEKVKTDKSVLLTTHYMDEADLLSDKIIIMAKGELICNGSSNFLKSKFGVGFVLTVAINTQQCSPDSYEQIAQTVIEITQRYCKDAKIDGHVTAQFKVILPNGSQRQFPHLFSELEARKHELKIDSFGVGINNLEQVFIKVTDMADPEESMGTKQKKKKESETEKSFSCMFIEKGEKIGVFELGVCTNEFSKDFFLFLCPPKSFASRLFCTQQMRCYRYWLIMKRSIPVAQGYTFETIEFDKNAHRYEVIFKIDEENFPSLTVKPICIDEIKLLLGVFDEYDLKIPIIAFCDNFSVICYSKNGGNYKFMDEWGGMHGNQLFINFDKKKTRFGTNAVTTPKTKMNTVVYDLIKIISMPADNIQVNEEWKFTFTKDNDHLVLIEFDSFDGTKKAASPTFLMAMLLKEHIKIIKNETVDKPDSLGFCVLNEFTEAEKRRVEEGLKEACKLLKIDTSFVII